MNKTLKNVKRLLSFFLAVALIVGIMPAVAKADTKTYTDSNGLVFEVDTETEEATLVEATNASIVTIEVPAEINGYTVRRIAKGAFKKYGSDGNDYWDSYSNTSGSEWRNIILPKSLTELEDRLFVGGNSSRYNAYHTRILYKGSASDWEKIAQQRYSLAGVGGNLYMRNEWHTKDGFQQATDGNWKYFKERVIDREATGMVQRASDGRWFYVENGVYRKKTGMVKSIQPGNTNGKWYYVESGIYRKKTGMVKSIQPGDTFDRWYYVENGIYRKKTGMVQSIQPGTTQGKWYFIENGMYSKKTGMAQSIQPGDTKGKWYFVEYGIYRKKTGMAQSIQPGTTNGNWYFIESGIYRKKTGMVQSIQTDSTKDNWYYVESGIYRKKTGVVQSIQPGSTKGRWYYVEKGRYNNKFTGAAKRLTDGKTVSVKKGVAQNQ